MTASVAERRTVPRRGAGRAALPAEALYGRLLATAVDHLLGGGPPPRGRLRLADGRLEPLAVETWVAPADDVDAAVLRRVEGPVLDIGCGPGRHLEALRVAGTPGLGVDLSPIAVRIARRRGADARLGSVFDEVPGAGSWRSALLLDGNIGIGGAPRALLARTRELLAPGGAAIVEVDPPGAPTQRVRVRLEAPGMVSEWFAWYRLGADGVADVAAAGGLAAGERFAVGPRWFAVLRRP